MDETPLGLESQFLDSCMMIHAMVGEMYHEFKKNKYEVTSSHQDQENKGKGEILPPPSPPSSPSSSSSSSSYKTSSSIKKKNKSSLIKLDVKFDLPIYDGELNAEKS